MSALANYYRPLVLDKFSELLAAHACYALHRLLPLANIEREVIANYAPKASHSAFTKFNMCHILDVR